MSEYVESSHGGRVAQGFRAFSPWKSGKSEIAVILERPALREPFAT